MKVFEEEIVKYNPNFFLAGRGGETNLHQGNHQVRQRVLDNAKIYASLSPRERGQKFALKILEEDLAGVTFVVRLAYFWRNYENGKIASAKLASVVSEHGSLSALESLPPTVYVTIGETWCLNIIGAILRQAAGNKVGLNDVKVIVPAKEKTSRRRSKRNTRANKQSRQQQNQDGSENSFEASDGTLDVPAYTEEPRMSTKSSICIPEEIPFAKLCPCSPPNAFKVPDTVTSNPILSRMRRVSLCPSTGNKSTPMELVSINENASFFPLEDDVAYEQAIRLPRLVSIDSIPEVTPSSLVSFSGFQDYTDPFDLILKDCDTEKWPQLDLNDLLSV